MAPDAQTLSSGSGNTRTLQAGLTSETQSSSATAFRSASKMRDARSAIQNAPFPPLPEKMREDHHLLRESSLAKRREPKRPQRSRSRTRDQYSVFLWRASERKGFFFRKT